MGLLNPNEYDTTTGLFPQDDRAKIVGAKIVRFDYNGTVTPAIPSIALDLLGEGAEKPITEHWGVGKAEDWQPSPDGKKLVAIGKRKMIHANTKAAMMFKSMIGVGVPLDLLDAASEDVTKLVGMDVHWVRTKVTYEGMKDKATGVKGSKDGEVVLVTELYALPGEEAGTVAAGGLNDKAIAAISRLLGAAKGGKIKKADIPTLFFSDPELAADPQRNDMMGLLMADDAVLNAGPWKFEGGVISVKK
jgi:hypothetical protein